MQSGYDISNYFALQVETTSKEIFVTEQTRATILQPLSLLLLVFEQFQCDFPCQGNATTLDIWKMLLHSQPEHSAGDSCISEQLSSYTWKNPNNFKSDMCTDAAYMYIYHTL